MAKNAAARGSNSSAQTSRAEPVAASPPAMPSRGIAQQTAHAAPRPSAAFNVVMRFPICGETTKGRTSSHLRSKHFLSERQGTMLPMEFIKTFRLFVVTALAEIVGCYLPHLWLKQGKSVWLLVPAAISLALFAWLLSLHPTATGRVYAAYGGVYIGVAILWLWLVDKVTPTTTDWVGVGLCVIGMAVIIFGSRAEG